MKCVRGNHCSMAPKYNTQTCEIDSSQHRLKKTNYIISSRVYCYELVNREIDRSINLWYFKN